MSRFVMAFALIIWTGAAAAQAQPIGGDVLGLVDNGLQLQLTTTMCLEATVMCLGHSTSAQPATQAGLNCTNECCSNSAFGITTVVDSNGYRTARGTCGSVVGFQPNSATDTTQFLTIAKGAKTFLFGDFAPGTIFTVTVSQQPTSPKGTCVVNDGFGGLGQPNPAIVVDCGFIFENGFQ
jgi:hypothetical protein